MPVIVSQKRVDQSDDLDSADCRCKHVKHFQDCVSYNDLVVRELFSQIGYQVR